MPGIPALARRCGNEPAGRAGRSGDQNWNDSTAFQPLLRLLHRSSEDLEYLLGDGITEGLGRIAAGMFDGDVDGLFDAIASRSVSEG